jgi:plasmid stabilization system protein ParE
VTRYAVAILPEAEQELREAFLWYHERSPLAADAFRLLVFEAIDRLSERADMWPANADGFRYQVLGRFPYTIWYDLDGTTATVLAIAHQHRRPRYWSDREG